MSDLVGTTFVLGVSLGDDEGETVADFVGVKVFVTRLTANGLGGAWLPVVAFSSDS